METPKPVNLNALKNILAKSKAVMAAVEEKNPTKPSRNVNEGYNQPAYNQPVYDESDEKELNYGTPDLSAYQSSQPKITQFKNKNITIESDNLPLSPQIFSRNFPFKSL